MPPDTQVTYWTLFQSILSDPVMLVALFLPFVILAVVLYFRLRLTRRLTAMSARNAKALDENSARWEEAAARTEKMIALLTEIRDHTAKLAAPAPVTEAPKSE